MVMRTKSCRKYGAEMGFTVSTCNDDCETCDMPKPDPELSDPVGFNLGWVGTVLWGLVLLLTVLAGILKIFGN